MIKRIEFKLNLGDPQDAAIYHALRPSLRYRRAGAVIRAALTTHLVQPASPTEYAAPTGPVHQGEAS
ncbi:MAG: hypothetical protein IPK19_26955 [Chloroflexi bacterium]|nr:hypothetical protein [Chloroflexota bacterium]